MGKNSLIVSPPEEPLGPQPHLSPFSQPSPCNKRLPARVSLQFRVPFLPGLSLGRTRCIFAAEKLAATAIWGCVSTRCMRETHWTEPSLGTSWGSKTELISRWEWKSHQPFHVSATCSFAETGSTYIAQTGLKLKTGPLAPPLSDGYMHHHIQLLVNILNELKIKLQKVSMVWWPVAIFSTTQEVNVKEWSV